MTTMYAEKEDSERKHGRILPGSKHVHQRLAHE